MAAPDPINVKPFSQYKLLSFDIYGTLIDWEGGITNAIWTTPYFSSLPSDSPLKSPEGLLKAFHLQERTLQSDTPSLLYVKLLSQAFVKLVKEHVPDTIAANGGDAKLQETADKFGNSVGTWPAFPDTVAAMKKFKDLGYILVPLSNTDRTSVNGTITGPLQNTHFDAVYIAEDIGSYKPNLANFHYLLKQVKESFGVDRDDILHVAQSLFHDHVPAKQMGLASVWVDRLGKMGSLRETEERGGGEDRVGYGWRVGSLGELAGMMEEQLKDENAAKERK